MRNPSGTTGWVISERDGCAKFLGTCFGFRRAHYLLTAAHCIEGHPREALSVSVLSDRVQRGIGVQHIEMHPNADLALLELAGTFSKFDFFSDVGPGYPWGGVLTSFGYPEDVGDAGPEPTPRFFRGHIQRLFSHKSHLGYWYPAIELSFGAPAGLSGGPVALDGDPGHVIGVVAENVQSSTWLETIQDEHDGQSHFRSEVRSVINYGVAVSLGPLKIWLDDVAPLEQGAIRSHLTNR